MPSGAPSSGTSKTADTGGMPRFALPFQFALVGASFHQQAFVVSPGANAAGLLVSNGATAVLGRP